MASKDQIIKRQKGVIEQLKTRLTKYELRIIHLNKMLKKYRLTGAEVGVMYEIMYWKMIAEQNENLFYTTFQHNKQLEEKLKNITTCG